MRIDLPVRCRPKCPPASVDLRQYDETALGYGTVSLSLRSEETALLLIDCWNLTADGPPIVPGMAKYWDYSFVAGGRSWLRRAGEIVDTRIAPCLARARKVGLTVIHGPSSYIATRYAQCQALAARVPEPLPGSARDWPPPDFVNARRRRFTQARYGGDCEDNWNRIRAALDIAGPLKPQPDETVYSTMAQLDHVLRTRRILTIVLAGFATNACVLLKPGAVADLAARGYEVVVLRDCTTAIEAPWSVDALHATRATLDYIEMMFGYTATSDDFLHATDAQE